MAAHVESLHPIQVFLDTAHFIGPLESRPSGGEKRDFFEGNNQGFRAQKDKICARLRGISQTLRNQKESIGFIHVQVRGEALAKSHRRLAVFSMRHMDLH